ncbi:MAG: outer membrane lipoprotein-sorting protein [Candidatus Glassbacteria bacterium]|nr:outer membrane lipoprotein-sorting protein [Candidatus Glassbacteria bacterium]
MHTAERLSTIGFLAAAVLTAMPVTAQELDSTLARRIIEHADTLMRGSSNTSTYRMIIVRPDWSRSITMNSWERGKELAYMEVTDPPREQGTAFLKREGQMWTFLPDIERTVKIPPSMMMDSWMGSDFTNDDLLKESSLLDDYSHELIGADTLRGIPAWHARLVPHEDAAVVWDRIEFWVRQEDFMLLREEYYDEKGRKVRTMYFEEIRTMDGREIPSKWILEPHLKDKGNQTVLEILDVDFNVGIPDRYFTRQHLERSR